MTKSISSDAVITSVRLAQQGSDPSAPASGYWQLFVKSGGLYLINSAGSVVGPLTDQAAVTVLDTATVDLALSGQQISANVISTGIKLDDLGTPDDNTDLNATTSTHGLLPKLNNIAGNFLNGQGAWATPTGSHVAVTVTDTSTLNLSLSEQDISGDVIASGIKLDDLGTPDDNTDLNATVSYHGLLPKLGGGTTNFLRADGTWAIPGGAIADHDHSGDAGDGGTFDAANLTSAAATSGHVLTANGAGGADWAAATSTPQTSMAIFTVASGVTVASNPLRIYNVLGRTATISQVFLSVNVAPTGGSGIIVDVNKNGTTIFTTQANRPTIAAGNFTGFSTSIDIPAWTSGTYLTADVDAVGSTVAGSDLTIHVVYS